MRMREDHWRMRRPWIVLSLCALVALLGLLFTHQFLVNDAAMAGLVGLGWEVVAWRRVRRRVEPLHTPSGAVYRVGSPRHWPRLLRDFCEVLWVSIDNADEFPILVVLIAGGIAALLTALFSLLSHSFLTWVWSLGVGLFLGVTVLRLIHILWFESACGPLYRYVTPSVTGAESLPGTTGTVFQRLAPQGTVKIHGVFWKAASVDDRPIEEGSEVIVERVQGLTLHVSRQEAPPSE